jgi:hypothetical protein
MAEPKYRTVKIPKPRSRGIRGKMALQQWQRSGGRQKQILNPKTGKYEKALFGEAGQRQVQKLYPTDEGKAAEEKRDKLKKEQADRNIAGAAEAKKKAEALLAETKKKREAKEAKAKAEKEAKAKAEKEAKAKADAEAKAAAESKIDIGRAPGPEAPPPPPPIRITEEAPKQPMVDLAELPIRDQVELNTVLKDLKNRVISPDFKTPTRDEIAEAVTKATGGKYTPPATKVAEPPPPKAEPVVPAPTGGMSSVVKRDGEDASVGLGKLFGGVGGGSSSSELDKLKERHSKLTGMRFIKDPGPEHFQAIKDLEDQITALDPSFVGEFSSSGAITPPTKIDIPSGGQVEVPSIPAPPAVPAAPSLLTPDELQGKAQELREAAAALKAGDPNMTIEKVQQLTKELEGASTQLRTDTETRAGKTSDEILADAKAIVAGTGTTADPVDSGGTFMPMPGQQPPIDASPREAPPAAPPPPTFVNMDPLQGVRETYVPTNILGPSYDPRVRENYAQRMMEAGSNIQQGGYLGFQMPTSAVPQVQFGGYGAPVPMAPLAPFAGLGGPPPVYSGAIVNPGTGQPEPVGMAPNPGLVNRPPGTGPIM